MKKRIQITKKIDLGQLSIPTVPVIDNKTDETNGVEIPAEAVINTEELMKKIKKKLGKNQSDIKDTKK